MAKITRFTIKQFGSSGPSGDFGQFGSLAASSPNYTKDPATIQSLAAFLTGWAAETIATNRPALEDMNGLDFLIFQALCYFQQAGIPEWDAGTTYYTNSFCQVAGVIYKSLQDTNLNKAPASEASYWTLAITLPTDLAIASQAAGDILYFNGTNWVRLAKGTASQQLKMNSGATAPEWFTPTALPAIGTLVDRSSDYPTSTAEAVTTDGFLTVICGHGGSAHAILYSDSGASPSTVLNAAGPASGSLGVSFTAPIKKGHYWKLTVTGVGISVYWIPFGS